MVYDTDLGPGVIRWERGIDGQSVHVERTVKDASGKVLFRDTFVSHYAPMDWIKRVGHVKRSGPAGERSRAARACPLTPSWR